MSKSKYAKHTAFRQLLEVEMPIEKINGHVARSTCRSQNAQSTLGSDHFWKLRLQKGARHEGATHIWKSNCAKHAALAPLLEVAMSKKSARRSTC
jgi:hypothetical protein